MPFCSTFASARVFRSSSLTSFAASSSVRSFIASRILSLRSVLRPLRRGSGTCPGSAREVLHARAARRSPSAPAWRRPRSRSPCRRARPRAASCGISGASRVSLVGCRGARVIARRRQQHVEDALLGAGPRPGARTLRVALLARLLDRGLDQIAHDRVDVAPDVADLGELGRLDLDERRVGEPREPARDLGLADAGRADHQDVLRRDLLAQRLGDLLPAPAVAQRDRDRALGAVLADDVLVELVDDFLRGHRTRYASLLQRFDDVFWLV